MAARTMAAPLLWSESATECPLFIIVDFDAPQRRFRTLFTKTPFYCPYHGSRINAHPRHYYDFVSRQEEAAV